MSTRRCLFCGVWKVNISDDIQPTRFQGIREAVDRDMPGGLACPAGTPDRYRDQDRKVGTKSAVDVEAILFLVPPCLLVSWAPSFRKVWESRRKGNRHVYPPALPRLVHSPRVFWDGDFLRGQVPYIDQCLARPAYSTSAPRQSLTCLPVRRGNWTLTALGATIKASRLNMPHATDPIPALRSDNCPIRAPNCNDRSLPMTMPSRATPQCCLLSDGAKFLSFRHLARYAQRVQHHQHRHGPRRLPVLDQPPPPASHDLAPDDLPHLPTTLCPTPRSCPDHDIPLLHRRRPPRTRQLM